MKRVKTDNGRLKLLSGKNLSQTKYIRKQVMN
jgi:hypothetical protein